MKLAVIGGTKFIGHAVSEALVGRAHAVSVVHRGVHPAEVEGVNSVIADRANADELSAALKATAADVVIDTLAMTRGDARNTLAALGESKVPVVVLSSQDVYAQFGRLNGLPAPAPESIVNEESPLTIPYPFQGIAEHDGGEDYDKKDVEGEFREAVGSRLPGATILRLPATYGSRDPQRRFGVLVDALDSGQTKVLHQGGASFRWTQGHVSNVAHAIVLAAEARLEGFHVFNVGEPETPTMKEWGERIASSMGSEIDWIEAGEDDPFPEGWGHFGTMPNDVVVDSSRIREALGYAEVLEPEECIADLVAGLRASRKLS